MNKRFLLVLLIGLISNFSIQAQLGFCQGNSGDPIFEENFGQSTQNGPPLPSDVTNYKFVNQGPEDGEYTISNNIMQLGSFHNASDHTGNQNGRALIVNASDDPITEPGLFYQIPITGLCINNSYEFSAFVMNIYNANANVCLGNGIPVNVKFQIWDETDTNLLAEGDTGDIEGTGSPVWEQFALTFTTLPGQNSVILKMLNNGQGGCGNDLAIDDIVFKSCGDFTEIVNDDEVNKIQICENESISNLTLDANPDFSVYDTHFYQWQVSQDGENWTNIPGETNSQLIIPAISDDRFYRTLVAEDPLNVNNKSCNSISTTFEVERIEFIDPVSLGDVFVCDNKPQKLVIQNDNDILINWYDSPSGGNLLSENSFEFEPESNGFYYAESITVNGNCINPNRVKVEYRKYESPNLNDELVQACEGEIIRLTENLSNVDYRWSTGETTSSIEVDSPGNYILEVTTKDNCTATKIFTLETFALPVIASISQEDDSLIIEMINDGDFSYSIDGRNYQDHAIFKNITGGLYTVYVREKNGCGIAKEDFLYFDIPKFFTPNGDQINDTFKINGDIYYDNFEIFIFDRFGKVLAQSNKAPFEWDGSYNGNMMPTDDYWYRLHVDDEIYSGNFTLKR